MSRPVSEDVSAAFREAVSGIITGVPGGGHVYGRADAPTRRLLYPERQPNGQALPALREREGVTGDGGRR